MRFSDWSSDVCSSDLRSCDVLLVDGFDRDGQPAQLCSSQFYRDCRSRLNPGGVLVVNLCDHHWKHAPILSRIRACRSEEHTSELQSLMRISYAVFCLKKKNKNKTQSRRHLTSTKQR